MWTDDECHALDQAERCDPWCNQDLVVGDDDGTWCCETHELQAAWMEHESVPADLALEYAMAEIAERVMPIEQAVDGGVDEIVNCPVCGGEGEL